MKYRRPLVRFQVIPLHTNIYPRGLSSSGRAPLLQGGGEGFKSPRLHSIFMSRARQGAQGDCKSLVFGRARFDSEAAHSYFSQKQFLVWHNRGMNTRKAHMRTIQSGQVVPVKEAIIADSKGNNVSMTRSIAELRAAALLTETVKENAIDQISKIAWNELPARAKEAFENFMFDDGYYPVSAEQKYTIKDALKLNGIVLKKDYAEISWSTDTGIHINYEYAEVSVYDLDKSCLSTKAKKQLMEIEENEFFRSSKEAYKTSGNIKNDTLISLNDDTFTGCVYNVSVSPVFSNPEAKAMFLNRIEEYMSEDDYRKSDKMSIDTKRLVNEYLSVPYTVDDKVWEAFNEIDTQFGGYVSKLHTFGNTLHDEFEETLYEEIKLRNLQDVPEEFWDYGNDIKQKFLETVDANDLLNFMDD